VPRPVSEKQKPVAPEEFKKTVILNQKQPLARARAF
jgi:hypothetical protein